MPNDDGNLIFTSAEMTEFIEKEPLSAPYFRIFLGAHEFINGIDRYCLWLDGVEPNVLRQMTEILQVGERIRQYRLSSKRETTRKRANTPLLFDENHQPLGAYLAVPEVSSSNRDYMPMRWLGNSVVASNKLWIVADAGLYEFGVLNSLIHMSWTRVVAGRLKSDYQYSVGIVYNNYPWPEPTDAQREKVEALAQGVLDARANHPTSTLADLYHPTTMPPDLRKAHEALDKAVDQCYRKEPFASERERVEFLFELYRKLTEGFGAEEVGKKKGKGRK